jgi:hypothetical protein
MPTAQEMQDSNTRFVYFLLTPFRLMSTIMIVVLLLIAIVVISVYEHTSWLVGLGNMGWLSRQHTAELLDGIGEPVGREFAPKEAGYFTADFSKRQHGWQYRWQPKEVSRIAVDPLPNIPGHVYPPDYCFEKNVDADPGQALSGWYNRTRSVYERKSSRMFEAYTTGAISVSYLRTTLTRIKLGLSPTEKVGPTVLPHTDCDMDPFDPDQMSTDQYARWDHASAGIIMPNAPVIRMRIIDFHGFNDSIDGEGGAIAGMCVEDQCGADDLRYYITKYADLFAQPVPLAPHQEEAVRILNDLAKSEYWLMVAHANHVYKDDRVMEAHLQAMELIAHSINPARSPGNHGALDFMGMDE